MLSFISRTAWVRPTKTARLTMLWPMLSSSMRSIRAIGADVAVIQPMAGVELQSGGHQRGSGLAEGLQLGRRAGPSGASA